MKAIILARVSTEEQKEAGNSLPAQVFRLQKYASDKGFEIIKTYSFDESAYKQKREEFTEVVLELKQSKDKIALCCDKIDRLIRNFTMDLITLEELRNAGKLELHFPSDNIILHKDSPAPDLFRFTIGVSLARYYSDSIGDNVKRAFDEKLRKGTWTGKAPIGYKNITKEDGTKTIVVDPVKSQMVKQAYELYATGAHSLLTIRSKINKDFNTSFSKGYIDAVMKNKFYAGIMVNKGREFPHNYPLFLKPEIFYKVQEIKASYNKKKFKFAGLPYDYRGLLDCAYCGCKLSPQKAKRRYIYYHCTQYKGKHHAKYISEKNLTDQFMRIFDRFKVPEMVIKDIATDLKLLHKGKSESQMLQIEKLNADYTLLQKRLDNMYIDKLDGSITPNEYEKLRKDFTNKMVEIDLKRGGLRISDESYYLASEYILSLANRAGGLFASSKMEGKRLLLKQTLQNLKVDGEKVCYDLLEPFATIAKCADSQLWGGQWDLNPQHPPPQGGALPLSYGHRVKRDTIKTF